MKMTVKNIKTFELILTENESDKANAVAAAAGIDVPKLLCSMLDSSLASASDALDDLHTAFVPEELDGDGNVISGHDHNYINPDCHLSD